MRKCYVVSSDLTEENKAQMTKAAKAADFEIVFFEDAESADGKIADGEVLYTEYTWLLKQMPLLKWCHSSSAGVAGHIATGAFDGGRAILTNSSGAFGLAISEYVIMTALMLMKRMPEYQKITEERQWVHDLPSRSIAGSNIAIIGTGDLGSNTARRFRALGARSVTGFNRSGRDADAFDKVYKTDCFDSFISGSEPEDMLDVLVLCVPGTAESKGLLSRERIDMLPRKVFIINVGRGMLIDQDALIDALNEERIAGAALDVVYPEPLPADHPLWDAKNCIITPHMSGDMGLEYSVNKTVEFFCENLGRYYRGEEMMNLVDIEAGY